jgi:predicted dehydrogenase|tara:strand:+ start:1373 stop:2533 length:1161 start_codon:yes stop_codon:yes gene_type:complete
VNILVVGAGMYVTGRHTSGPGSALGSIGELSKTLNIDSITVVSRSESSLNDVIRSRDIINKELNIDVSIEFIALGDDSAYKLQDIISLNRYDCAIVALPDHLHYSFGKLLIENKIHCFFAKPLTATLDGALGLVSLQKKNKVLGMVDFHKRYDEVNLVIKDIINKGDIGLPISVVVEYSQKIEMPTLVFSDWVENTNVFQYLGVHYVDMIHFLTSYKPEKVMAVGTYGILKEKGINTYDSIHATIVWYNNEDSKQKMVTQFSTSWIDPSTSSAMSDQKYTIIGTKGRIKSNQKHRGVEVTTESEGIQSINPYFSKYHGKTYSGYDFKSISQFFTDVNEIMEDNISVDTLDESRPTFKNTLPTSSVLDAVNTSLTDNSNWVYINDLS